MADQQRPHHFDLPFRVVDGRIATVEQGGRDDLARCAELILRVPEGTLDHLPEFGRPDWAFALGAISVDEARDIVRRWDDRIAPTVTSRPDPVELALQRITVTARRA